MKIEKIHHASIKLIGDKIIYFDPYDIREDLHDADYIFITNDHYDHYDVDSIHNVSNNKTKIIVPECLKNEKNDLVVLPGKKYQLDNLCFDVIPSYNIDKKFHPREKNYVGYNILLEDRYFYIMGDTDRTPESEKVKANVCFVPIGGVYTMDCDEAVSYINDLKPDMVMPIHYGKIVGDESLGNEFMKKINKNIKVLL